MGNDYHSDITHISKSGLDLIHKAPVFYKHAKLDKKTFEPTKALIIGNASHMYLLEPDEFHFQFTVSHAVTAGNNINIKDFQHMQRQREIIHSIPEFARIFKNGVVEQTFKGIDVETGVRIKCRTDLIDPDMGIIIDPKFVKDASPRGFKKHVYEYRYHVQDAFYKRILAQNGIHIKHFIFLAIEKTPPYAYGLYVLNKDMINQGIMEINEDLRTYAECMRTGVWSSYTPKIMEL